MVLGNEEILKLIETPSNTHIKEWREDHNTLKIYTEGGDVAKELSKIDGYENTQQEELRKKIARSTKSEIKNLLNPINKVFNASGGSTMIKDITDAMKDIFNEVVDELPEGISVQEWVEIYLRDAFIMDPNSVVFIETGNGDDQGKAYPTYKSINVIHDYQTTWDEFEYIIFIHGKFEIGNKQVDVYRVVDDEKDGLYYVENNILKEFEQPDQEAIIKHNYGYVPAVLCGGIVDKDTGGKLSFIDPIDENLKEYLRALSVFMIYKFLHLFPKFWQFAMKCVTCDGTGRVKNTGSDSATTPKKICPTCNGKRLKVKTDVSDGIHLPIPKGDQPVLNPVAGYIDLPVDAWEQMKEDLRDQVQEMQLTLWGSYLDNRDNTRERTATETFINVQPVNENLQFVSRCFETKESQILTYMARIMSQSKDVNVVKKYGKRFTIESPDVLWEKYIKAKEKGSSITDIEYHHDQYLLSEFQNDIQQYQMKKKQLSVEPFAHYSIGQMSWANNEQIQRKGLFSEWMSTNPDFDKDVETLKKEYEEYFMNNKPEEDKQEQNEEVTTG